MKQRMCGRLGVAAWMLVGLWVSSTWAKPPKVLKATPDNGAKDVDPATREIRIVFDQAMSRDAWSVVGGGESFPKLIGKPTWVDDRTFVWSIRLEPNHEYWLSINNQNFTGFRNKAGEAAEPYPIAFTTGGGKAAGAKLTAEDNRKAIAQLKRAVDEDYSYRDRLKLDWDKLFKDAGPKLESAQTPKQFALDAAKLLASAKDMHIWLKVENEIIPTHRMQAAANMNMISLSNAVPGFKRVNRAVASGRFPDGIVYMLIATWDSGQQEDLEAIYDILGEAKDAKGLIIDVRPNSGGAEPLAQKLAGCFIDQRKAYSKNTIRSGGQFAGPYERFIEPNKARPGYRGKIAVLMGPVNVSSCESFLLMMKQAPACKLVGERSYGSSGNPKPVELENGVTVFLPSWQDFMMDGTCLEGKGIEPDIPAKAERTEFLRRDPVLDAALKYLRSGVGK